jgi:hypothetical protein
MMTRKDLLIKSAYGAGALIAVNGILPGLSYLERVFAEDNTSAVNISERDHFLLRHASLAPSGHNTQPWRVKIVSDNEWIIGWDKSGHSRQLIRATGNSFYLSGHSVKR